MDGGICLLDSAAPASRTVRDDTAASSAREQESYGGIRTAGLVWHLQSVHGMNFDGVVVVSPFLNYIHDELDFGRDETYQIMGGIRDWDWEHRPPGYRGWEVPWANLRGDLAMAMTMNPGLHLLVQQGYYDLATPTLATKHDIDHLDIPAEARERIRLELYEAGHMMYLHEESMRKFREDLASFVVDTDRL